MAARQLTPTLARITVALWMLCFPASASAQPGDAETPPTHSYTIERSFLTMRDGVRLAATLFRPTARTDGERFPALLELLPYRKDDSFYLRDFPIYDYFARRGFLTVKVDIRGTGGSEGQLPSREYSDEELTDAEEIIAQLAARPDVNGQVGMWGISWSGFNALQVAMRHPPALKAILALHSSDDLFYDDVRYIDGVLHLDAYALQIDHENGLPRTPGYALDAAYFADRFDREPWLFEYLRHSTDDDWWRRGSLRFQYDRLTIPAYFIGGLVDGYRDTPLRALRLSKAPVKVEIGPWAHDWPDNGTPAPRYEWRSRAVRWWRQWLQHTNSGLLDEPQLLAFVRAGQPPDRGQTSTAGAWRFVVPGDPLAAKRQYLMPSGGLASSPTTPAVTMAIPFRADAGQAAGDWWGNPTGDMQRDDRMALTFDSAPLPAAEVIVGAPAVTLQLQSEDRIGFWSVRLEDVAPDGSVALVTGALRNGAFREGRLTPRPMIPGDAFTLDVPLHFTTWTFQTGHRIRISVATSQFPMAWPSPSLRRSTLTLGAGSYVDLPAMGVMRDPVSLPVPEKRRMRPDARWIEQVTLPPRRGLDPARDMSFAEFRTRSSYTLGATRVTYHEREWYGVNGANPGNARFEGNAVHEVRLPSRVLRLETTMVVTSTADSLVATFRRHLTERGREVRDRTWRLALPRVLH